MANDFCMHCFFFFNSVPLNPPRNSSTAPHDYRLPVFLSRLLLRSNNLRQSREHLACVLISVLTSIKAVDSSFVSFSVTKLKNSRFIDRNGFYS